MRILIVGSGAVGGYFGVKLALGGHQVIFLARGAHAQAIREAGLQVETPAGLLTGRGEVIEQISSARGLSVDVALVAVKAPDLKDVATGTGEALSASGVAIPLLNGLDSEVELAELIGEERVIGGVAQMAGGKLGPGRVYIRGDGFMTLAALVSSQKARVQSLTEEFASCFVCRAHDDLNQVLWQKLLWNAPFNGICALTRRTAGDLLARPELEQLVREAMLEVVSVGRAEGVRLDEVTVDRMLQNTKRTFPNTEPSMLQDVLAGRPTECEAIQGALVRRAQKYGIPTPIHATLLGLLRGLSGEIR
jgi:2-dehydropantoate 2-reductase